MARGKYIIGPWVAILLTALPFCACGPWCFQCDNVFHPAICTVAVLCGEHEVCFVDEVLGHNGGQRYNSGCRAKSRCSRTVRDASVHGANALACSECCSGNGCNANLCGATDIKHDNETLCLSCQNSRDLKKCDKADICDGDQMCVISKQKVFGIEFYTQGCMTSTTCSSRQAVVNGPNIKPTLEKVGAVCCASDFCNDGSGGLGGDISAPTASVDNPTVDYVIGRDGPLTLTCHYDGKPAPTVEWQHETTSGTVGISSGVNTTQGISSLTLSNLTQTDSGKYLCVVKNKYGNTSAAVTVSVNAPPEIVDISQNITLSLGDSANLTCNATGDASVQISWDYDKSTPSVTENSDGSLSLVNVEPDTMGLYTCVASNKYGNSTESVLVTVLSPPNVTLSAPKTDFVAGVDPPLILTCKYTGGPVPTIEWHLLDINGQETILTEGVVTSVGVSTLTLTNVTSQESGDYSCVATNNNGTDNQTISVNVFEPAKIVGTSGNITLNVGDSATLVCNVTGNPAAGILWKSLPSTNYAVRNPDQSLALSRVDMSTTGVFTCTAVNAYGNDTADIYVTVVDPVKMTVLPKVYQAVASSDKPITINIQCLASGTPTPTADINRFHGNYNIDADHHKLSTGVISQIITTGRDVSNVMDETGIYVCTGDNGQTNATEYGVVYRQLPNPVDCNSPFGVAAQWNAYGAICPAGCTGTKTTAPSAGLTKSSLLCQSAIDAGGITDQGGLVVWLGLGNGNLKILNTKPNEVDMSGLV